MSESLRSVPRPYADGVTARPVQVEVQHPGNERSVRSLTHLQRYLKTATLRGIDVSDLTSRAAIGRVRKLTL